MSNTPLPGQTYRHFKGNLYQIVTLAEHSETGEQLVIYQAMYGDHTVYARPLSMFCEKVDRVKYPDANQELRFELQKDTENLINESTSETKEEYSLDPLVIEFLDATTYEARLNILAALHHRITDDMITTMAMSADVEVSEGDTEERFEQLKKCLLTLEKYESSRVR